MTVHNRYFGMISLNARIEHDRLARLCFVDFDREIALVAISGQGSEHRLLGLGRLVRERGSNSAEFAVVVSDLAQGRGLGSELVRRLIEVARAEKLDQVHGRVLSGNGRMLELCRELGFHLVDDLEDGIVSVRLDL